MQLFGKLHPLFVHLPIGFLLIGIILHIWETYDPKKQFSNAITPIYLLGAISATLSCLTGLQLMRSGEYDTTIVERHRNTGICLAILSFYCWHIYRKNSSSAKKHFYTVSLFILILITGHYGGTLTHGSEFLSFNNNKIYVPPVIKNINEAVVYQDLIEPIIQNRCVSCHGAEKMKGNLRLDQASYVMKGGKNGTLFAKSDPLLLKRILLPPDDEEHMPPKEKGQLTTDELTLIKWWIEEGADFNATVKQLKTDKTIVEVINRRKSVASDEAPTVEALPDVPTADPKIVAQLIAAGASITPLSANSNLVVVNLVNLKDSSVSFWNTLAQLSAQLFTLKAEHAFIKDDHVKQLANCTNLHRLSLKNTSITDLSLQTIRNLTHLSSLNLSHTAISSNALNMLANNKNLRYLYLLNMSDTSVHVSLANVEIIDRPFQVSTLETDTTKVKESKE